jgi:hypothetical protein
LESTDANTRDLDTQPCQSGMHLDPALLDQMAAQGTALVPS